MKKILIYLSLTIFVIGFLTACAKSTEASDAYKGESQQQIFKAGKESLLDHGYVDAVKRFEALDVQYPYGPETERAQLYLIYAYYMREEYALSVAAADRFIRLHPLDPNIDYAYYMRGLADYYQNMGVLERMFSINLAKRDLTQIKKSYADFNELVSHFPNSRYTPSGRQYMVYLRNILADHELKVAEYYYERKAYVAAANRASDLVAHYQGAPAVVDGLVLMVKSYHQLGLPRQEQDALRVLKYNYPNMNVDVR